MEIVRIDSLYQPVNIGPAVIPGGWRGAIESATLNKPADRVTIECVGDSELRRICADMSAALRQLPDPVDLVMRQEEEGRDHDVG